MISSNAKPTGKCFEGKVNVLKPIRVVGSVAVGCLQHVARTYTDVCIYISFNHTGANRIDSGFEYVNFIFYLLQAGYTDIHINMNMCKYIYTCISWRRK